MKAQESSGLDAHEIRRYGRQIIIPEVDVEGQRKLRDAHVLVVGAGGLGSPASLYLAAAGVGHIGLVDADCVDESNLQRQILYGARDVGYSKTLSARERLRALNPLVEVTAFETFLNAANAAEILSSFDVVVDCSDNFPTRYLVNDACVLLGKPDVSGAIHRFEGQVSLFGAEGGPCYRCFFAEPPEPGTVPTCAESGVLGVLPGIVGSIQATEVIKHILGGAHTLAGRLLLIDAWTMHFRELALRRNPACPVCGENPTIRELIDYEAFCGVKKKEDAGDVLSLNAHELKTLIETEPRLQIAEIREPHEIELIALPNRLVMPMGDAVKRMSEFDPSYVWVFVCKFGIRSESAVRMLLEAGHAGRLYSLRDGILGWIREIGEQPGRGKS